MLTNEQLSFLLAGLTPGAAVLRAQPHSSLLPGTALWQSFYPLHHTLQALGHTPTYNLNQLPATAHLYLVGSRHKDENRSLLGFAASKLPEGGTLTTLLPNNLGAKSLEADLRQLFGTDNVSVNSKHHARRMVATKTTTLNTALTTQWQTLLQPAKHVENTFYTQPGIFSWREVDAGSRLLAEHLPTNVNGHAADLGAGWGYLSHALLQKNPDIKIDLFEAEHLALDCARKNLETHRCTFNWCDVTTLTSPRLYDLVISNPPVHNLHHNDVGLGIAFAQKALQLLAPKGQLYLVANRHLPYEALLKGHSLHTLATTPQYKIIHAQR